MTINYAHRGAGGYCPENTMASFKRAIELGCDAIETDVQMTKDGALILMHDEMVNRTTSGAGLIKDHSFEEIRKLDAGSWFSREYQGEKVPTVEELLELASENNIAINFEIKTEIIRYEGIEEKLIETINKYNMQDKVILSSFNHYSLKLCKEIDKNIKTGILYTANLYKPYDYAKTVDADAIHPYYYTITSEVVKEAKANGIMINPFTVDDINCMKYFVGIGIDGIITNYPDKLKKVIEG